MSDAHVNAPFALRPDGRYARQELLPQVGREGQARLGEATVLVVGLGALGGVVADLLVRAGVGHVKLVDRDVVDLSNLQRQTLYATSDLGQPKASAAAGRLERVNPQVRLTVLPTDVNAGNVLELLDGVTVAVDCTDNAQTRYLMNDACVKLGLPWVYGGAVGSEGRVTGFARKGGEGPCLRCLFPTPPAAGELPTCDAVGVFNAVTATIGALQAQVALRLIVEPDWVPERLVSVDIWSLRIRTVEIGAAKEAGCPTCGERSFLFLEGAVDEAVVLCGRGVVQMLPPGGRSKPRVDLLAMEARWRGVGETSRTQHLVRVKVGGTQPYTATLFADGRLLLDGQLDVEQGRILYDRLVGT